MLIAKKYNSGQKETKNGNGERKRKEKGIQSTTRTSQPSNDDERKVKVNIRIM